MKVKKRNGTFEDVRFDAITDRITSLCYGLNGIDPVEITRDITTRVVDGISTSDLDQLTSEICASKTIDNPDFGVLAARLVIDDHQKSVDRDFSQVCWKLYYNKDQVGEQAPLISKKLYKLTIKFLREIDNMIDHTRDYFIDYFGFKTLMKGYLLKVDGKPVETPQHMWLRVALGIHGDNLEKVKETYDLLSTKYFTHATPTLFNAGTNYPQLSSCYLVSTDDSIEDIFKTVTDCAKISKWAGGIGIHISSVRAKGSYIRKTGGRSDGVVPMLRVYNTTARYINQGGRRNGSFATYMEPWHADVLDFLECKKNHGDEELRARDLFYALWIPDLFMKRVQEDGEWTLMCPSECPGLNDVYGDEFDKLYTDYEVGGKGRKTVKAREVWESIINSQIETGTPYMLYKDACNRKSNQKNLGTIKSSNLCAEIIQYSDQKETAVCNLASLCLPKFIEVAEGGNSYFNFEKLLKVTEVVVNNLNKVIDINFYPIPETETSNMLHRPVGVGVQGLVDVYTLMRFPFESTEAFKLNREIFETIYFGALRASCDIAEAIGPYETFGGSPLSQGQFQFDLWDGDSRMCSTELNYDWEGLRTRIKKHGVRNSLLVALMPTASTSQIMGNTECIEVPTSNVYTRRTLAGEFPIVNKLLVKDLMELNLWNTPIKEKLMRNRGSVQDIDEIPNHIKALYKTIWEVKQKAVIDQSAERGRFVDQSQSLNLFFAHPDFNTLQSAHFYGWKQGLKTGSYYIRSKPAMNSQTFSLSLRTPKKVVEEEEECIMCSS